MTWVATVKGYTNRYFCKLCRYIYTGNNVTVEFYYYDTANIVASGIKVGTNLVTPVCYRADEDKNSEILCCSGIAGPPTTLQGTFTDAGNVRTITWAVGGTEVWTRTDHKWTLTSASYCHGDCHGWAFESQGTGQLDLTKTFTGEYQRYNGWDGVNEPPVSGAVMNFYQMALTNTGVLRFVQWDPPKRSWVYRYLAFVGDRVIYQVSHDFNNDGKIDTERGHTYVGYPIFQSGQHRGFVFADCSEVVGAAGTFSAIYYWE